jgi:transcription elongation factor S-II
MIENIETKKISAKNIAFEKETSEDTVDESEVTDGIFQCRKCGSKKTTYYSLQTRSADEPMTNFITCVHCKHRWKM